MYELRHEEKECSDALSQFLGSFPYDSVTKYAANPDFRADNPRFHLIGAEEVSRDNVETGMGGNCIILPEILRRRLETRDLHGKLIADEAQSHVVLAIPCDGNRFVICDPGLLCIKPFPVSPEIRETEVYTVDNPGGKDQFGFSIQFDADEGKFTIRKDKAKTGTRVTYDFDLKRLGNLEAVRATDIKNTLELQIPIVSKVVMPKLGTVAALDSVSVRDNRGKVNAFAHRTGIDPEVLWDRLDIGNQVRRTLQAFHTSGGTIDWNA